MRVRRLRADEWQRWRELRLAMLENAPYAFGSTYAEALTFPDEAWQERATSMATAADRVLYVAEDDGDWLGCAGGYVDDEPPYLPNVFGVWTRPDARGRRLAEACVREVVEWARGTGAAEVRLWATDGNTAATRVYERVGFTPIGHTQPLPSDPTKTESEYALPLG
jgi:predicted GNAT family acetyltransferase